MLGQASLGPKCNFNSSIMFYHFLTFRVDCHSYVHGVLELATPKKLSYHSFEDLRCIRSATSPSLFLHLPRSV